MESSTDSMRRQMNGGSDMKNFLKRRYALTDAGAENVTKAAFSCFLTYCNNMAPMLILMALINQLMDGRVIGTWHYVIFSLLALLTLYLSLSNEYVRLYDSTYKESAALRSGIAEKLSALPIAYFSRHDLSDVSQVVMADVERIEHSMSHSIPKVIGMCMFFPVVGIAMLVGNWKMGLSAMIPTLLSFAVIPMARKRAVALNGRYFNVLRENSEAFQEAIELHQEISSFRQDGKLKEKLYRKMEESERIHLRVEAGSFSILALSTLFSYVSLSIVVLVGIRLLVAGELSLPYLVGYVIGTMKIKELFDISKEGMMEMFFVYPAVARIRELWDTPLQEGHEDTFSNHDVALRNVSFSYDDHKVLDSVSFDAGQGKVTALVGMSGSGKTTALRLISRLYDYDSGEILIDGKDIRNIATESLFKHISMVFQDVVLFNASIMENIRLGREDATDDEVVKAARQANCMDFIERLPDGFDTMIGENGAKLSGGERQRLSIARAFLKNAPILLLDEISASLDVDNEKKIQDSLNELIREKTVIIISHRLKSIENADSIVVFDHGHVVDIGSHEELIERSEVYANLIRKSRSAEEFEY